MDRCTGTISSSGSNGEYLPPTSVTGTSTDTINATVGSVVGIAQITVTVNSATAPVIVADDANPLSFTQLQLTATATDPLYPGTDSHLIYTWQLIPVAPNTVYPTFSDNGTNSAKTTIATVPGTTLFDYQVILTVTNSIGQSTTDDTLTISDVRNLTTIALTPLVSDVGVGKTQIYRRLARINTAEP